MPFNHPNQKAAWPTREHSAPGSVILELNYWFHHPHTMYPERGCSFHVPVASLCSSPAVNWAQHAALTVKRAAWWAACVLKTDGVRTGAWSSRGLLPPHIMRWRHEPPCRVACMWHRLRWRRGRRTFIGMLPGCPLWGPGGEQWGCATAQALRAGSMAVALWVKRGLHNPRHPSLMQVSCRFGWLSSAEEGQPQREIALSTPSPMLSGAGRIRLSPDRGSGQWPGSITPTTKILHFLWLSGTTATKICGQNNTLVRFHVGQVEK